MYCMTVLTKSLSGWEDNQVCQNCVQLLMPLLRCLGTGTLNMAFLVWKLSTASEAFVHTFASDERACGNIKVVAKLTCLFSSTGTPLAEVTPSWSPAAQWALARGVVSGFAFEAFGIMLNG